MSGSNLIYLSALARVREGDDGEPATTAAAGGDGAGASVSTDTPPKTVNDDFPRIQVIGSIE